MSKLGGLKLIFAAKHSPNNDPVKVHFAFGSAEGASHFVGSADCADLRRLTGQIASKKWRGGKDFQVGGTAGAPPSRRRVSLRASSPAGRQRSQGMRLARLSLRKSASSADSQPGSENDMRPSADGCILVPYFTNVAEFAQAAAFRRFCSRRVADRLKAELQARTASGGSHGRRSLANSSTQCTLCLAAASSGA